MTGFLEKCTGNLQIFGGMHSYTHTKKYPPGKQKFGDLCPITQEPVVVQKRYIPHLKALILSFYEPEGLVSK